MLARSHTDDQHPSSPKDQLRFPELLARLSSASYSEFPKDCPPAQASSAPFVPAAAHPKRLASSAAWPRSPPRDSVPTRHPQPVTPGGSHCHTGPAPARWTAPARGSDTHPASGPGACDSAAPSADQRRYSPGSAAAWHPGACPACHRSATVSVLADPGPAAAPGKACQNRPPPPPDPPEGRPRQPLALPSSVPPRQSSTPG